MLKKIRVIFAAILFVFITLLFLDFSGTLHAWFSWLAKIQFVPALLAVNAGVCVALLLLTFLLGRVYCSVICPLGVFQDGVARLGRRGKKLPYTYSAAKKWLRYGVLALFVVALVAGVSAVYTVLEPYSAYGRIANNLFQPLWQWGNNLLAFVAERVDSYAFYATDVWIKSIPVFAVAVVTFVIVSVLAWRGGRTYCNTICPVGTFLGVVSNYSLFKIRIDAEKCNKCSLCARNCKASCIDYKNFSVDASRCVACMNCIDKCPRAAIAYKTGKRVVSPAVSAEEKGNRRRGFLTAIALLAGSAIKAQIVPKATDVKMDGGLADILDKQSPERLASPTPAGSESARHFKQHCTACQLCISVCPNGVLRPSSSLENFMQPTMSFERGYCRAECVKCSEVCPASAIRPITKEVKSSTQIGHAEWVRERCIPVRDEQPCDNCERHCPTKAITMVLLAQPEGKKPLKIPTVNEERCIGCGACENLCPSRPVSAIYVEGHASHKMI